MFFSKFFVALFAMSGVATADIEQNVRRQRMGKKKSNGSKGKGGKGSKTTLMISITNLAPFQPFSPYFVMTHNDEVPPLFMFGAPASAGLRDLAENGSPDSLVAMYSGMYGVGEAFGTTMGATGPGATQTIMVEVSKNYPYVTLGSMFVNTNDGFIAINGRMLEDGDAFFLNGYDAGTEINDQLVDSIPGPCCPGGNNNAPGNGEGFVHVHPGYQAGIGDMTNDPPLILDWRNPMAYVVVTEM